MKSLRWILVGCIVAALCIAAFLAVQLIPKPETSDGQDSGVEQTYTREGTSIYTVSENLLYAVSVQNGSDTFQVLRPDADAYIEGAEGVPLMTASINALYESVLNIRIESYITERADDLSDYGLAEPQATLTVIKTSGSEDVFYLGDKTPDGKAYYFKKADSDAVYAVSTYFAERLLKTRMEYFSTSISYIFEETGFVDLSISYPDPAKNIYIRMCTQAELDSNQYESSMIMTSPFVIGANTDAVRSNITALRTLTASSIVCIQPKQDELERYGLNSPVALAFNVDIDKTKSLIDNVQNPFYDAAAKEGETERVLLKYRIGKTEDGVQYVMFGDADVVYAIKPGAFDFVRQSTDYFCQRLVALKYLKDLDWFSVQRGEEVYKINVSVQTSGEKTVYSGHYQGRTVDGTSMQRLYRQIIGLSNYGMCADPGATADMTIVLHAKDGTQTLLEFVPTDETGLYAFARIDGSGRFRILTSKLDLIWANTKTLVSGGKLADIY